MTHARLVLGALGAVALATAGCGSSGGGSAAPAPHASTAAAPAAKAAKPSGADAAAKAAYVRRADAVCRDARRIGQAANAQVSHAFAAHKPAQAATAIDRFVPAFKRQITRLEALPRPKADAAPLHTMMEVLDAQVATLQGEAQALRANDTQALQSITTSQQRAAQLAEMLGKQYGFKVCGRAA